MPRRATWCRCCHQQAARVLCEPCVLDRARSDGTAAAIVRQLFGSCGWEAFTAALRAERIRESKRKRGAAA
jgi:hypothetical protein